jgi:hypothetical protein
MFQQATLPYTFDVQYGGGGLRLEWSTAVSINGAASPATGLLVSITGMPYVGEGLCGASGTISLWKPDEDDPFTTNYLFTLRMMERCPNLTMNMVTGGIDGCVGN